MEPWRITLEPWRLTIEQWRVCRTMVAGSLHFDDELSGSGCASSESSDLDAHQSEKSDLDPQH